MSGSKNLERLFIAIPLTDSTRDQINARLRPLPGRVVPPANWHFTLRFLGDTLAATRDALISGLGATHLGKIFTVRFDGIGAFPRAKRARIIWLGVGDGSENLVAVAEKVETVARRAGFPAETRPFRPHLTLSRVEPPRSVTDVLSSQPVLGVSMPVTEVVLVRSRLGSGPAKYEVISHFDLES
jgi:2'-5' RNA ligase